MQQLIIFITLGITLILFVWGKLRYDIVALLALFAVVIAGIIPAERAFLGFGHPAVITVAAVLIISRALERSGLVDIVAGWISRLGRSLLAQISILSFIVGAASGFMNNTGALAVLMPVAVQLARKSNNPPSYILMPIAFASILGGLTTLIGTPPNIIIATFRGDATGNDFGMFDFTPVGLSLAIAGLLFTSLLGWRLLPKRKSEKEADDLFQIENYITEVKVKEDSLIRGKPFGEVQRISDLDVQPLGLVRKGVRMHIPSSSEVLKTNDVLILEADTDTLKNFIRNTRVQLVGEEEVRKEAEGSENIQTTEVIVMEGSPMVGQSAESLRLRSRYSINLLAIARREKKIRKKIDKVRLKTGDVLLLQGKDVNIKEAIRTMHCLPIANRDLRTGNGKSILYALGIFGMAIACVVLDILEVQVAFSMAAVFMVVSGILPLKEMYTSVDWPVIVLLGAMIQVGEAFEASGSADLIAAQMLEMGSQYPVWILLGILMIITIALSNIVNNAATVVLMAPIAIRLAHELNLSVDTFLMTVAVAGSCAFLTPIGHQSNTLVMGPGGYKFTDYWKMGLPLTIGIILLGIPLILFFWPP